MKLLCFNSQSLLNEKECYTSVKLQVTDNFELTKIVNEISHYEQKTDEEGNKLFLKDTYEEKVHNITVGYDETIEITEKPAMVITPKVDSEGNKLYKEIIYDDLGEPVDSFETIDPISEKGEVNQPLFVIEQKKTENGKPIYLRPIIEERIEKIYVGKTETTEETDEQVIIPIYHDVLKDINSDYGYFTLKEVLEAFAPDLVYDTDYNYILIDYLIDSFDTSDIQANIGNGIACILPNGYMYTGVVELSSQASTLSFNVFGELPKGIDVFINDLKVESGVVNFVEPTSSIKIKFVNTTDRFLDIKPYYILY